MIVASEHVDKSYKIPAVEGLYKFDTLDCCIATNILYPIAYQLAKKISNAPMQLCLKFKNKNELNWDEKTFFKQFYCAEIFVKQYARFTDYNDVEHIALVGYYDGNNISFTFYPSTTVKNFHIACTYNPNIGKLAIDNLIAQVEQEAREIRYLHYWRFNRQWYMKMTNAFASLLVPGCNENNIYSYLYQEDYLIPSSLDLTHRQIKSRLLEEFSDSVLVKEIAYHEGKRWFGAKQGSRE